MKKILNILSIITSKLTASTSKICNIGSGTSLPGKIALKISPDILSVLVNQSKKEIITITGTNGKTTTSGFVAQILKHAGRKTAHNKKGANMLTGLTTAVIEASSLNAVLDVDHCLLEIDEAYLPLAFDHFQPELLLVTNLFRDQLDRYGELDATANKIQTAINKTTLKKPLKLILNADDPMVSKLQGNDQTQKIFYGFDEIKFLNQDETVKATQEIVNCACGKKIEYSKIFYGHLGHYSCNCGYSRPITQIRANAEISVTGSKLVINSDKTGSFEITTNMPGLYNASNALAAVALGIELNISIENIKKGLADYATVFGRAELVEIQGKPALIQLIKNPIGATEVLRTVKDDKNSKLLIIINDNYADGRDVSWLWDANFELLQGYTKEIITSGVRASDMAVRLKYAGLSPHKIQIVQDIKEAITTAVNNLEEDEKLYILPTYTALLEMQKII